MEQNLLKVDLASLKVEIMVAKNYLQKDEGSETTNRINLYQKRVVE